MLYNFSFFSTGSKKHTYFFMIARMIKFYLDSIFFQCTSLCKQVSFLLSRSLFNNSYSSMEHCYPFTIMCASSCTGTVSTLSIMNIIVLRGIIKASCDKILYLQSDTMVRWSIICIQLIT